MFIAAPFTTAKTWKQPKCPQTDEWIKKMWDGTSLLAQWLRIHFQCTGHGLTPGWGTKIPQAEGQLSLYASIESLHAAYHRAHLLWSLCTTAREKPIHCTEEPYLRPDAVTNKQKRRCSAYI